VKAVGKTFIAAIISLPELRLPLSGWRVNRYASDDCPLGGRTLLPPRDPVLVPLMFQSIWPGFILWSIDLWVREAVNGLTPVNILGIFKGPQFLKSPANL